MIRKAKTRMVKLALVAAVMSASGAAAQPAHAFDIAAAFEVAGKVKQAWDGLNWFAGLFGSDLSLQDVTNQIVDEMRDIQLERLKATTRSLFTRYYSELATNRDFYDYQRYGSFMDESQNAFWEMHFALRDSGNVNIHTQLAPALSTLVPLRGIAMRHENDLRVNMGMPERHTWAAQWDWRQNALQTTYLITGSRLLKCGNDVGEWFLITFDETVLWKKKHADYWFFAGWGTGYKGGTVPLYCNVSQWSCDPRLSASTARSALDAEWQRIAPRFDKDPAVIIARAGLQGLMDGNHNLVDDPQCGPADRSYGVLYQN